MLICLCCSLTFAYAQKVKVLTTAVNGPYLEQKTVDQTSEKPTNGVLRFKPETRYQEIDGFGAAITYSACYNLLKMSIEDRTAFLKKTYSDSEGYGYSYARISIGCNDFSSTEYSLCDDKGPNGDLLRNFRFYSDERDYVIPVLKEILAINPNVKIIAAPWTCPKWMKVDDVNSKNPHDRWTDGHLNPDLRATYAQYFVKFVNAMKAEGINIYAVCPQNEPLNRFNCASLYMPWQEEAPFVAELAKAFRQNSLSTKIYLFDHNYNYDDMADQQDYPVKVYNALGNSFEGSELVVGAAYHNYGGDSSELTDIHNQAQDKELIFSESSIGEWNNGRDLSVRLIDDMKTTMLSTVNQWCKAVMVWNLMLDVNKGPNLDGGCQTCYGAVDIQLDYKTINYNSHYYILAQMASVVKPRAVRIATTRYREDNVYMAAFKNVDGTYALVVCNDNGRAVEIPVSNGRTYYTLKVPARGIASMSFLSQPTEEDPTVPGEAVVPYTGDLYIIGEDQSIGASHYGNTDGWDPDKAIRLTNDGGGIYHIDLLAGTQINPSKINFKFFMQAGWGDEYNGTDDKQYHISTTSNLVYVGTESYNNGNVILRDGKELEDGKYYRFTVNASNKYDAVLSVDVVNPGDNPPTVDYPDAYTGGLYIIGADASIGLYNYGSTYDWNPDNAINVPQISTGVYQIALTAGQQINPTYVNFKFFLQPGWGSEYQGSYGSDYRITTTSDLVYIGNGTEAAYPNDNGNIYLRDGKSLTYGTVYNIIVDATNRREAVLYFGDEETTGIAELRKDEIESPIYNIAGLRLNRGVKLSEGIYIVKGKKYIK